MLAKLLLAGVVAAHGLIHLGFVSPAPPASASGPTWPFHIDRSPLLGSLGLDPVVLRALGVLLVAVVVVAFAGAALAILGVLPAGLAMPAIATGAVASLGLLGVYFNPMLVIGIAIDGVLLWLLLVGGWQPAQLST